MNKKYFFQLLFVSLLAIFVIGCSADKTDKIDDAVDTDTEEVNEATSFPLEVTDSTGNTITLENEPTEIVSVMPSNTEILFALDVGDKVIGVTENDTYPEEVLDIETVGDFEINVEKIVSLNPDLVLAHESSVDSSFEAYEQIQDSDIDVYFVTDAQSIEETYDSIVEIGTVTGANDKANEIVDEMKDEFSQIEALVEEIDEEERKSALFEVSPEPEIFTGGQGTFFHELIELVGAENAAGQLDGWAPIDPEAIVDLNPDVILTVYGHYVEDAKEQIINRDGFNNVTAIENEAIYDIDEDTVSRPGPRLVEGAKEIGKAIYPDHFTE